MRTATAFNLTVVLTASLGLIIGVGSPSAAPPRLDTAVSIRRSIDQIGARGTVERLWNSRQWNALFDHVARGEPGWIALVPRLREGSDAGASEELNLMLVFALPLNARAVLAAMDPRTGPDRVCTMRFIDEVEPAPPGYKRRAIAAVSAVKEGRLQDLKAACLSELGQGRD